MTSAVLVVRCQDRRFGLPLPAVERVLPMAAVLPLPGADNSLMGMLNLHGKVVPVVNPHARLGLTRPHVAVDDRLVLLKTARPFLLWVQDVEGVVAPPPEAFSEVPGRPAGAVVAQILRLGEDIVPLLAPSALEPEAACA